MIASVQIVGDDMEATITVEPSKSSTAWVLPALPGMMVNTAFPLFRTW